MPTINDQYVSQMVFDNSQFEKATHQSMQTLDELKAKLDSTESTKAFKGLDNVAKNVDLSVLEKGLNEINSRFTIIGKTIDKVKDKIANSLIGIGRKGIKSFEQLSGLDQMNAGVQKFGQMTSSVNTIMTATGKSIGDVNEAMDDLNWFSDMTSYSFTQMADTIGKFTSAGVELNEAKDAVKGIALWAAESGQNASTASRVMYQLSQAYGSGVIKLQDWKSVELANMGTQKILNELIAEGGDEARSAIAKYGSFRDSLRSGWLTTERFNKVMSKYSAGISAANYEHGEFNDTVSDFSKKAFAAAEECRTFEDVINALSDAASSGWSRTIGYILGNSRQSAAFLTGITNDLLEVSAAFEAIRNNALATWSELGGRQDILNTWANIVNSIISIVEPIKQAFASVFGGDGGEILKSFTGSISDLSKHLVLTENGMRNLYNVSKVVFTVLKNYKEIIKMIPSVLKNIANGAKELGLTLLGVLAYGVKYVYDKVKALLNYVKPTVVKVKNIVVSAIATISNTLKSFGNYISGGFTKAWVFASNIITKFSNALKEKASPKVSGAIESITNKVKTLIQKLKDSVPPFQAFQTNVGNTAKLNVFQKALITVRNALLLVGGAIALAVIKVKDLIVNFAKSGKVQSAFTKIASVVSKIAKGIVSNVVPALKNVWSWIERIATYIWGKVTPLASSFAKNVVKGLNYISENIKKVRNNVQGFDKLNIFQQMRLIIKQVGVSILELLGFVNRAKMAAQGFSNPLETLRKVLVRIGKDIKTTFDLMSVGGKVMAGTKEGLAEASDETEKLGESAKEAKKPFQNIFDAVNGFADRMRAVGGNFKKVGDAIRRFNDYLNECTTATSGWKQLIGSLVRFLQKIDFNKLLAIGVIILYINTIRNLYKNLVKFGTSLDSVASKIEKATSGPIKGFLNALRDLTDGAKVTLGSITDYFKALTKQVKTDYFLKMAAAIGILAASVWVLSNVPWPQLIVSGLAVVALTVAISIAVGHMAKTIEKVNPGQLGALAFALLGFSVAVLAASKAIKTFADISEAEKLADATKSFVVVCITLATACVIVSKAKGLMLSAAFTLTSFALSIVVALKALEILQKHTGVVSKALGDLKAVLDKIIAVVLVPIKFVGEKLKEVAEFFKNNATLAIGALVSSGAILIIALRNFRFIFKGFKDLFAFKIAGLFGKFNSFGKGIFSFGKKAADTAKAAKAARPSLLKLAAALLMLYVAIKLFAKLDFKVFVSGLGYICGSLIMLAGTLFIMDTILSTMSGSDTLVKVGRALLAMSSSLVIIGVAFLVFAKAMKKIQDMGMDADYVFVRLSCAIITLAAAVAIMGQAHPEKVAAALLALIIAIALLIPMSVGFAIIIKAYPEVALVFAGLVGAILALGAAVALVGKIGDSAKPGIAAIVALVVAVTALSAIALMFKGIPIDQMYSGIAVIVASLGMLSVAVLAFGKAFNKHFLKPGPMLAFAFDILAVFGGFALVAYAAEGTDWPALLAAGASLGIIMGMFAAVVKTVGGKTKALQSTVAALKGLTLPIIGMMVGLAGIAFIAEGTDWAAILTAGGTIGAIIISFGVAAALAKKADFKGLAGAMLALSGAVLIMSVGFGVLSLLASGTDWQNILAAGGMIALIIAAFGVCALISKGADFSSLGIAMMELSVAVALMSAGFGILAYLSDSTDFGTILLSAIAIGAIIAEFAIIATICKGADFVTAGLGMVALGIAVGIMCAGFTLLATVPWENVQNGVLAIGGLTLVLGALCAVLGIVGSIFPPVAAIMGVFALVILSVAAAALSFGAAAVMFGIGANLVTKALDALVPIVEDFTRVLPGFTKVLPGFAASLATLGKSALPLLKFGGSLVVVAVGVGALGVAAALAGPTVISFATACMKLILTAKQLAVTVPNQFKMVGQGIIPGFVRGLASNRASLLGAGKSVFGGFLNYVAHGIFDDPPGISKVFIKIGIGTVVGQIKGLFSKKGDLFNAGKDVFGGFVDKIKGFFDSGTLGRIAEGGLGGMLSAIKSKAGEFISSGGNLGNLFGLSLFSSIQKWVSAALSKLQSFTGSLKEYSGAGSSMTEAQQAINEKLAMKNADRKVKTNGGFDLDSVLGLFKSGSDYDSPIDEITKQVEDLTGGLGDFGGAADAAGSSAGGAGGSMSEAAEDAKKLAKAMKQATLVQGEFVRAYGAVAKGLDSTGDASKGAKAAIDSLALAYYNATTDGEKYTEINSENMNKIMEKFGELYDNVKEGISGAVDYMSEFDKGTAISTRSILKNIKSNQDGIAEWAANMEKLAAHGFSYAVMKDLQEQGPKSSALLRSYLSMSIEEVNKVNQAYKDKTTEIEAATNQVMAALAYATKSGQALADIAKQAAEGATDTVSTAVFKISMKMDELAAKTADLRDKVEKAFTPSSEEDYYTEFEKKTDLTADKLIENMQSYYNGASEAATMLAALGEKAGKGLVDQGIISYLSTLGPKGYETIHAFYTATDEQLNQMSALYQQDLQIPPTAAAQVAASFSNAGLQVVRGFAQGVAENSHITKEQMVAFGGEAYGAFAEYMGIASPSVKMYNAGAFIDQGLANGIGSAGGLGRVRLATTTLGNTVISTLKARFANGVFFNVGLDIARGLAAGIRSGELDVVAAAESVATKAVVGARHILDSHSPSRVFYKLGMYVDQGFANGITDNQNGVVSSVEDMSRNAINALGNPLQAVADLIGQGIDEDMTIRPILDLSNVETGVNTINSMFDQEKNMAADINTDMTRRAVAKNEAASQTGNTTTNTFGGINLYVTGAPGQDVNQLADVVMNKLTREFDRRRQVFA